MMTREKITELTKVLVANPFPYEDCRALQEFGASDELTSDLDSFLADLAGFAQNPESLLIRPPEQIERYTPILSESFFARFPRHRNIAVYVTRQDTPALFEQLSAAEAIRPVLHEMLLAAHRKIEEKGESA